MQAQNQFEEALSPTEELIEMEKKNYKRLAENYKAFFGKELPDTKTSGKQGTLQRFFHFLIHEYK